MTLQDKLLLIYTLATCVQVIVVAVSVWYIYGQTSAARQSVAELARTAKMTAYLNHRQNLTAINNILLLGDENLLDDTLGYSRQDILAFMLIGYAELVYLQHREGIVDDAVWSAHQRVALKFMSFPFVASVWSRFKREFLSEFVDFVDARTPAQDIQRVDTDVNGGSSAA